MGKYEEIKELKTEAFCRLTGVKFEIIIDA
jgi:hypothetical protein